MSGTKWKDNVLAHKGKFLGYGLIVVLGIVVFKATVLSDREVMVAPVARRDVAAEVEGSGTVTVDVLANVGSKITGRVERVLVDENDFVHAGQLVVVLEDMDLRREVERDSARLEAARASAWQVKRAWEREKELVATGAVSQEEADGYEERSRTAESAVQATEAELRYQEFKRSEAKVLSAVSGLVTKRWVEPGDAVVAGQPVVTVADTSVVYVAANVDQRFAGTLHKGEPATVVLRGREGEPYRGRVYRVNPQADPAAEEMIVEVAFPLPAKELQIGQWAEVYVTVGKSTNALVVPKPAIMPFGNNRFVFVVENDGTVRRVKVQPVATSPRLAVVAVTGALKPGERVILNPMGLKGGETVRVAKAPMPGAMPAGAIE